MKKTWLSFLVCLPTLATAATETSLCINEIMQSNVDCYMYNHDFPDSWIELYNPTSAAIDIKGYYIGLSSDVSEAYQLPTTSSISVGSKKRVVIFCDKAATGRHTNFRLESTSPGTIYLFNASKKQIATLSYPAMPAPNIAYGRKSDGVKDNWGWELTPTPGTANKGGFSDVLLPEPVFSMKGQVMSSPASLTITMPEGNYPADTKIYLTTDGKEPTTASQSGTSFTFNINKNTVIRAKLISASALSRPSTGNSYIFHPRATNLPIVSILTDADYLYSSSEGIFSDAITENEYNYNYDWRRPISAEYFDATTGKAWFNQLGEVAVAGNFTREKPQKSMKLYANKRFGTKRYNGTFWEEKPSVTKVKSFMLRNGGNFSGNSRINDALIQRISGTGLPNLDYQAYNGVIVYINGEFKGIFGQRERHDEDYTEANYNIEDIHLASHVSYFSTAPNKAIGEAERAESTFGEVYNIYTKSSATYTQMDGLIDVDNFMKAMIAEMFSTNYDYPQNNVTIWRPLDNSMKWRWILYDMDFSFSAASGYEFNMFKYMLGSTSNGTLSKNDRFEWRARYGDYDAAEKSNKVTDAIRIYTKMISFNTFREAFIDAFAVYLGDIFKPSVTIPFYEKMRAEIESEVEPTFLVYNPTSTGNTYIMGTGSDDLGYYTWINYLKESLEKRPAIVYQQMADFFNTHPSYSNLGTVIPMTLQPNGATVTINDVELTKGDFDGAWFSQWSLRLNSGADGMGWKMQTFTYDTKTKKMKAAEEATFKQREVSILLSDYTKCDSVSFSSFKFADNDFDKKIADLGISYDNLTDWSQEAAISFAEPRYAYANITCESFPTTKNDDLHAYIDLYDNNGNYFHKKILLNLQGDSQVKNNLSVSFCEDEWVGDVTPAITFGDWVAQDEFHLKGFYNDGFRGTSEIAYQFYSKITERENCYPKAFPISLYFNGNFYGIMSWQLKKHRDNMGLDKKVAENVWLDGTLNDKQLFQGTINWTKFEVRNPKDLYNMDGTDYDGDNPQEIIDETSSAYTGKTKMVRCATAKKYIKNLSNYCAELKALEDDLKASGDDNATKETMRAEIQSRFDVTEIVNYKVFSLVTSNYDGFSKNWQWFTRDGVKWTVAPYDCNLTFGYNEDGTTLWEAEQSSKKYNYMMQNTDSVGPMLWIRKYFWEEVKSRYALLRDNGVISSATIMDLVNNWYQRIGEENYAEEWAKWAESPCVKNFTDSPDRIEGWINDRIALEDRYLGYATETVSYTLSVSDAKWATLCLPFAFEIPDDMKVYSVTGVEDDGVSLVLEEVLTPLPFTPYLINAPQADYVLSGEEVLATGNESFTNGLLTGTLEDIYAPADSYVLQYLNELLGFYHVSTENTMPVSANRAYLTIRTTARYGHFRIPDNSTSIRSIMNEVEEGEQTFNLWGQKSKDNENGFFVKRMPDGSRRKVFIKK